MEKNLENHSYSCCKQDLEMNAKSGGQKLVGKQDIFCSQMISPKVFINSKGEKSGITMEKPSGHHVYQVIWTQQDISTSGNL